ncbi:nicotinamidase-related amidase [Arthrobacter pascens]|uniref:isochorismatase family protein n=1 Tax=Arthrobacter pascens TaxID=1677 RepID=UPI00278FF722|nr:isochorismatase family protein [Arthrobacter pascens]MDQ0678950.1 nicotinamidase-related amidase [Arthrobacter pascens]
MTTTNDSTTKHVRLDPDETFMLLIDHQEGTLDFVRNVSRRGIVQNARALARVAKALDMPVVLTSSQEDQAQGPLIADLKDILPEAHEQRVRRGGVANAWADPDFRAAALAAAGGRRNVIIAGVTNDVCTVMPAISLVEEGFSVKVVQDAGGSINKTAEDVAVRTWERAGALTTTTGALIAELGVDWSTARGGALAQITFEEIVANLDAF